MIEIKNISKTFGNYKAIDSITANIKEKQVFGLIGTNGAGKSTMLRIIGGIYQPDGGEVTIDGLKVWDNPQAKRNISILPKRLLTSLW